MSDGFPQEPGKDYAVGYGRPPVAHQFQPGNRANPGGRPKGRSLTARLRKALRRKAANGKVVADALIAVLLRSGLEGDLRAIRDIFERVDGTVLDRVEVTEVRKEYDVIADPDRLGRWSPVQASWCSLEALDRP